MTEQRGDSIKQSRRDQLLSETMQSKERYDSRYKDVTSEGYLLMNYEPGSVFKLNEKEYVLSENHTLDIPYGEDLWSLKYPENYRFGEKIY